MIVAQFDANAVERVLMFLAWVAVVLTFVSVLFLVGLVVWAERRSRVRRDAARRSAPPSR